MERRSRRPYSALRATRLLDRRYHYPHHRPCDCGCDFYRPEWLQTAEHAILSLGTQAVASSGDSITFANGCNCDDHVLLYEPGIYYAHYTLHMPGGQPVHSDFHLMLDDAILPDSLIHIEHEADTTAHAHGHAMFEIGHPAHLHLITQQDFTIRTDGCEPLITLAVFRIG